MSLVDSNIFIYGAGRPHPCKQPGADLVKRIASGGVEAIIDAEVPQEILHRYRSIGRWRDGRLVYDLTRRVVPVVIPITVEILDQARQTLDSHAGISARDALHAAACLQCGADAICTYDTDFSRVSGIKRVEPQQVA